MFQFFLGQINRQTGKSDKMKTSINTGGEFYLADFGYFSMSVYKYNVMPVLFKNVERIEAFLFLYFIAMIIQALIERDIRINMEKRDIASIPIYPEGRECSSPTAYRILSMFDNILLNHILIDGMEIKKIHTDLTEMQKRILWLLDITEEEFWRDQ